MSTVVEYWTKWHEERGANTARSGGGGSYEAEKRAIEPWLKDALPRGGRVLDFGCGPGRFRPAIESVAGEYVGIDIIPGLSTIEPGAAIPGSVDAVVAIMVLQHITDDDEYIRVVDELLGALRPGGLLFLVDHEPDSEAEWGAHMLPRGRFPVLGHVAVDNMQGLMLEDLPRQEVSLLYKQESGLPAAEAHISADEAPMFGFVPEVLDVAPGVLADGWHGIVRDGDAVQFPNDGPSYRIAGWRDRMKWVVCERTSDEG